MISFKGAWRFFMKNRDKKERNGSSKNIMKQVLNHIGKYKFYLAFSIVMAAVSVVLTLYIPILTGQAVDCIVGAGAVDFDGIWEILKTMVVIILLTAVVQWLMNTSNNKIAYQVVRDVRDESFRKLEILPLKYIDGHSHGDIVSRIIADVDQFSDGLLLGFTQLFTGVVTIVGTLLFMLSINVPTTIVVVILTPLSFFIAGFIAKRTFSMSKLQSETRGEQTALINEMIDNEKIVLGSEFFEKLFEKYDLAVFTGRPREEAFYSLRKFGIDKYFKYFVCLEDVPCGRSKPCPDGLNKIKQNCYYNNICFFGDTVDDAKAGCDAGVLTYGIIPPNAADVENTVKSLMDFGAADVIKSACEILEYNLFEEKTCRLKQ